MTKSDRLPLGQFLRRAPRYGINAAAVPFKPGVPTYIRITDIDDAGRFAPSPRVGVSHPAAANYILGHDELLFARTGASVGKSYRYDPTDGQLVYAGFLINVAPDLQKLDPRFLAIFAHTREYWDWIARTSVRSGQPGVNGREYASLPIPIIDIGSQRKIGDVADDFEGMIRAIQKQIRKQQEIRHGMLQQLMTGRTRLPGYTSPWEWRPFPDVMERLNAKKHQIPASAYSMVGKLPVVDQGQKQIIGYTSNLSVVFNPGDEGVVVFGDHTCITKFVDFDFAVGADGTQILRAKVKDATKFYAYALELDPVATTGYNRHFKFLRSKVLPCPEPAERRAIVTAIADADDELTSLTRRLAKTRALKQGMVQKLLTSATWAREGVAR